MKQAPLEALQPNQMKSGRGFPLPNQKPMLALGIALAAGILMSLAYAQVPWWWAAWLAPGAALASLLLVRPEMRGALALAIGLLGGISSLSYYTSVSQSVWIAAAIVFGRAMLWSSMLKLTVSVVERSDARLGMFALPVILAAADTLINRFSPHGGAGSLAYSQMDLLPIVQLASVGGTPAIVFTVGLGGSAFGFLLARFLRRDDLKHVPAAVVMAGLIVGSALIFGTARLQSSDSGDVSRLDTKGLEVALVARDSLSGAEATPDGFRSAYWPALNSVSKSGRLVLLPEALLHVNGTTANRLSAELGRHARNRQATIVAGFVVASDGIIRNRAAIASPTGAITWYDKHHLVPGFEDDSSPGRRFVTIDLGGQKAGIAICKDMHFASMGRSYARLGVDLMIVPANDFVVDRWMTQRMTALRGVEGGYSVVRTARNGNLSMSDPFGRIIVEKASLPQTTTIVASLPDNRLVGLTLYAQIGDLFGWLCAAMTLLTAVALSRQSVTSVP